jgi:HSP20 family molecular chaperone IbpA
MFPWNFFPFNKEMKNKMKHMNHDEIDQFIKGIMGNVMPAQSGINPSSQNMNPQANPLKTTAFETHDSVFVRLPLKDESVVKELRIYHTANQLIVENFPEKAQKHSIPLPAMVRKKGSSAKYQDGILEIKLIKSSNNHYSQIDVTEI